MSSRNQRRKAGRLSGSGKAAASTVSAVSKIPQQITMDHLLNEFARMGTNSHLAENTQYNANRLTQNYGLMDSLYRGDWIANRIISAVPEDMTKNWFELTGTIEPGLKGKLRVVERKTHVQARILEGLRWGRLYGGAAAIMVIKGQEDMLDQPLDLDMIVPGSFKGLIIADRWNGVYPSSDLVSDMDDPDFGLPEYYTFALTDTELESGVRIHHSRILRFVGRDLPYAERLAENNWGMSELEHVYDELNKRNYTSANIAQLVFIAHLRVMKIEDLGQTLALSDAQSQKDLYQTIQAQNMLMNNFSMQVLSQGDEFQTFQYSFSGLSEVYQQFMMDLAGAAEIPATKLFGRAPQGMNATGEGDLRNYYDTVRREQERVLRPIIEKLLPVLCLSAWGMLPDDLDFEFNPIRETSDQERAGLIQQSAGAIVQVYQAGLISQQIALKELRQCGAVYSMWTNISDEDIEHADDTLVQPDDASGGEDPMTAMAAAMEEATPPEAEGPEEEPSITGDGGPGSGNFGHPGYPQGGGGGSAKESLKTGKKASLRERAAFLLRMLRPKDRVYRGEKPASAAEVERNNREREEWSELSLGQRLKGSMEQERRMRQVKSEVAKQALQGNVAKAQRIMNAHRHYWGNDPDSTMKVQAETLKRQKRAGPSAFE